MSLAADTRDAVREYPFLLAGLRAGVINYTAAAEFLDLDGETEAVATALRRFADDLPDYEAESRTVRVTMHSGVDVVPVDPGSTDSEVDRVGGDSSIDADEVRLLLGGTAVVDGGDLTAVVARGAVDGDALAAVLDRLAAVDVRPEAAAVAGERLLVAVDRRDGARAVRTVEAALAAVPA